MILVDMEAANEKGSAMNLNDVQRDALTELINIGFGRAANALSMLAGNRVVLQAPQVGVYPVAELENALDMLNHGEITSIHQVFSGTLCGNAMLLLDNISATTLVDLMNGGEGTPHEMDENDREALIETGNILLNSFIGSFGNLLSVHVSFAVPSLRLDSLRRMVESMLVNDTEVEVALVIRVHFFLIKGDVSGYVVIVMGLPSIDALMEAMRTAGFLDE
jgi:chemotaxis protein CheC